MSTIENDLKKVFNQKKVLITGHTGFKGSWLSIWLKMLGANVTGISVDIPSNPSHYKETFIEKKINNIELNIQDLDKLKKIIIKEKPDFIFHLAAQSLVRKSYNNPLETWKTNLIGTINVLECLRALENCVAVIITSDKCYDNKEWIYGYKETDTLGGSDPYSASKGSAEIAIKSYINSFYINKEIRVASARAGNVIGGGDWAEDRIIPDCVRSWSQGKPVELRNPSSTRPWQHVLEPLSGYLRLASMLDQDKNLSGESFNFGPSGLEVFTVEDLVSKMSESWKKVQWISNKSDNNQLYESGLLKLNCDKALSILKWKATLNFEETVRFTSEWYSNFYNQDKPILEMTESQIREYLSIAELRK